MNMNQSSLPLADRQIFRHEVEPLQNNRCFHVSGDEAIWVLSPREAPTFDIGTHIVENELHPLTKRQYRHVSIAFGLFFEDPLNFWIGTGDHRPWFPHAKIKIPEDPLTLSYAQIHGKLVLNKGR